MCSSLNVSAISHSDNEKAGHGDHIIEEQSPPTSPVIVEPTPAINVTEIVHTLRHGHREERISAATEIFKQPKSTQAVEELMNAGAVAPLAALIRSSDDELKDAAMAALSRLTDPPQDMANRNPRAAAAIREGLVVPLIDLLFAGASPKQQEYGARVLADLAYDNNYAEHIANAGAIPPLVALLRSDVDGVKMEAVRCLSYIMWHGRIYEDTAADAGVMPLLVDLISAPRQCDLTMFTASVIALLCRRAPARKYFLSTSIVQHLIDRLNDKFDHHKDDTALALMRLACTSDEVTRRVITTHVIPKMIDFPIQSYQVVTDEERKRMGFLAHALHTNAIASGLVAGGGIPVLINYMRTGTDVQKETAEDALKILICKVNLICDVDGGVDALIDSLWLGDVELRQRTLGILSMLCECEDIIGIVNPIRQAGFISAIVHLVHTGTNDDKFRALDLLKTYLEAQTLYALNEVEELSLWQVMDDIVETAINVEQDTEVRAADAACWVLEYLAKKKAAEGLSLPNDLEALVSDDNRERENEVVALWNRLSLNVTDIESAHTKRVVNALVEVVRDREPNNGACARHYAALVLLEFIKTMVSSP